jgi:hypothetical protein
MQLTNRKGKVLNFIFSEPFNVIQTNGVRAGTFDLNVESTPLIKSFARQGIKLPVKNSTYVCD